jgi:thiamine biosynthesis lipoprotein
MKKHLKKSSLISFVLVFILLISGCQTKTTSKQEESEPVNAERTYYLTENKESPSDALLPSISYGNQLEVYSVQWFQFFDTINEVTAYTNTEEEFKTLSNYLEDRMNKWHKMLDKFRSYEGITNVHDLNASPRGEWIELDPELLDILVFSTDMHKKTNGSVNIALGAVTDLWQNERDKALKNSDMQGELPDEILLKDLGQHVSIDALEIDVEQGRARITDEKTKIDLGSTSKGYISQILKEELMKKGYNHILLNFGGNLATIGDKPNGDPWRLAIRNPKQTSQDSQSYAAILDIVNLSLISSGDYERFYYVGDKSYHHIIDPETMYPSNYFSQVTIISDNAAWGDALSTALFNVSVEEGEAILKNYPLTAAYWITKTNEHIESSNFSSFF